MTEYIVASLIIIALMFVSQYPARFRSRRKTLVCFILAAGVLTYISAVRFNTGYDYPAYANMYIRIYGLPDSELYKAVTSEKGFVLLCRVLTEIGADFDIFFTATSVLFMSLVSVYIWRRSKFPIMGLLALLWFGYYFNSLCLIRNMMAAAIFIYAFKYVKDGRFLRYCVLALFACTFHFSAIFMILMYPLLRIPFNYISLGVYTAGLTVFMIISTPIMKWITANVYTSYDPIISTEMNNGLPFVFPVLFALLFILAFVMRERLQKLDPNAKLYITMLYFNIFFEVIGIKHAILSRFALYFAVPSVCVLLPLVVSELVKTADLKKTHKTGRMSSRQIAAVSCLAGIAVIGVVFFIFQLYFDNNGVIPYINISTYNNL